MVDIESLLQKVDILEYVSQYAEFKKEGREYWCCSPLNLNDKTPSFSINIEKHIFYCFSTGKGGNTIDFIMEYNRVGFKKALEILCDYVGGDVDKLPKLSVLTNIFKRFTPLEYDNTFVPPMKMVDDIMEKYTHLPIKEWLDEGISNASLEKYQVKYDLQNNRIVFPIWDNNENIISVCGRTLDANYKEKRIRKYTYYSQIKSTYFFYGFWQNKDEIIKANEILIYEGAKSVFKSEDYGHKNAVASLTDKLSPLQIEELIKIPVRDVVICWDKGVSIRQIKEKLGLLLKFKNCYAVIDNRNLLKDKDAPVDQGKNTWLELYKNKQRVG